MRQIGTDHPFMDLPRPSNPPGIYRAKASRSGFAARSGRFFCCRARSKARIIVRNGQTNNRFEQGIMTSLTDTQVFNRPEKIIEGWYWAMPSSALKRGKVKPFDFFGRQLALYRAEDGRVVALDAYCPHMGAHLAEGKVEGSAIRCLFHYWKYDAEGRCVEIPCQEQCSFVPQIRSHPAAEQYGLIWLWAGREVTHKLPFVPELEGEECEYRLANRFVKECHPNVMMINAIDAQHFNSVHSLPVDLELEPTVVDEHCITFTNRTRIPRTSMLTKFLGRFYRDALTYRSEER